jgi:molybdopterin-guanine dinucleotide biosynthesis protein A
LRAGRLKIVGFFPDVRVLVISEAAVARVRDPALVFMNVNTPEELARARELLPGLESAPVSTTTTEHPAQ